MKDIKSYKPSTNSISSGQVLHCPYDYEKTKLIIKEMTENLVLELVEKHLVTNQIVITVGYDIDNLSNKNISYKGEVTEDRYGRKVPKHAHGTINLEHKTSSTKLIMHSAVELFDRIIDKNLLTRRINITANNVVNEYEAENKNKFEQMNLFIDYNQKQKEMEFKEKNLQKSIFDIKKKYGKNAVLKGMNFIEGGTMIERNAQVGGHKG